MKWYEQAFVYHVFTLGFNGCLGANHNEPDGFRKFRDNIDYIRSMGADTILFGPVFESSSHGYDLNDLYLIDKRLGSNNDFKELCKTIKMKGMRIILDAVFHHSGREMTQFVDVRRKKDASHYKDWFHGINFSSNNSYNDGFSYHGWNGDCSLVKYDLMNGEVIEHLFNAVKYWINEFNIDGLRIDASDYLEPSFLERLRVFTQGIKEDFWLMGEVVHGDYRRIFSESRLHSATNYECYKGLYSSFNDRNLFEIAYSLNRLFGQNGVYRGSHLYNFVDNHDVSRIYSILHEKEHIFPLYVLLFTMPGIPSVYYGSESRVEGIKGENDNILRPGINLNELHDSLPGDIFDSINRLSNIRRSNISLTHGSYRELLVTSEQLFFERRNSEELTITGINSACSQKTITVRTGDKHSNRIFEDILNNNRQFQEQEGILEVTMYPAWGSILKCKC